MNLLISARVSCHDTSHRSDGADRQPNLNNKKKRRGENEIQETQHMKDYKGERDEKQKMTQHI